MQNQFIISNFLQQELYNLVLSGKLYIDIVRLYQYHIRI